MSPVLETIRFRKATAEPLFQFPNGTSKPAFHLNIDIDACFGSRFFSEASTAA